MSSALQCSSSSVRTSDKQCYREDSEWHCSLKVSFKIYLV